jgi:hypothetical protein
MTSYPEINAEAFSDAGFTVNNDTSEIKQSDNSADLIMASGVPQILPVEVSFVLPYKKWFDHSHDKRIFPLFSPETYHENILRSEKLNLLLTGSHFNFKYLKNPDPSIISVVFTFNPETERYAPDVFINTLAENNLTHHIILNPVFRENDAEDLRIKAAALLGRYLTDKQVSGICITNIGNISFREVTSLAFSILQCTETRITRTMYLSCPTCGRTKFNLRESVRKVKEATGHLKGLKIAVMGCIVNGPGEMAGADYGYVGAGNGKVHIYRGTEPVQKNIPENDAVSELLKLIEADSKNR